MPLAREPRCISVAKCGWISCCDKPAARRSMCMRSAVLTQHGVDRAVSAASIRPVRQKARRPSDGRAL